jgi:hypothetical protein
MEHIHLFKDSDAYEVLEKHCQKYGIPLDTLEALIKLEQEQVGRERRRGYFDAINDVLDTCDFKPTNNSR